MRHVEARYAEWVVAARGPIIAATLILVAIASSGMLFLGFTADYRIFFSEDNPQLLALEALEGTYGKSDNVLFPIVPDDGDVSVVSVTVELPAEDQLVTVAEVAVFARELAAEAEEQFAGIDLRVLGTVMISQAFTEASIASQRIFLPASLAIMTVVLWVLTRGLAGLAATGMVIVFSILASMGLGGWVGLPFSPPRPRRRPSC